MLARLPITFRGTAAAATPDPDDGGAVFILLKTGFALTPIRAGGLRANRFHHRMQIERAKQGFSARVPPRTRAHAHARRKPHHSQSLTTFSTFSNWLLPHLFAAG